MTRKRHREGQIIAVLKDAHAGLGVQELSRKHGISDAPIFAPPGLAADFVRMGIVYESSAFH